MLMGSRSAPTSNEIPQRYQCISILLTGVPFGCRFTRREIEGCRPLGDPRPVREHDIWTNWTRNISRQPEKTNALDLVQFGEEARRTAARAFLRHWPKIASQAHHPSRPGPFIAIFPDVSVPLPPGYMPSTEEAFMNASQVEYFRQKLLRLRADIEGELAVTPPADVNESGREGDQADQASAAEDREFGLINRRRAHGLLGQIERALIRLDNGTYGYCEDTGEPIALARLEAQPTATLTTEAQAARERRGR